MPDITAAVAAALARHLPAGPFGVAVSGGSDSTALLIAARRVARAGGRELKAATVDHGLRPESAAEAAAVGALCARLGVAHEVLVAEGIASARGNLAAAARAARFSLLAGWAARHGLGAVLLGHTMDDQAETVLLRLARGSGAEGLSAMRPAVAGFGTLWLRPLLGVRRNALRGYLRDEGVSWIEDPSNDDLRFGRVRARRALAALAPLGVTVEGLARTAGRLAHQRRVLEAAMAALAARARAWGALGEARLDPAAMRAEEEDTALRLLADTLVRVAGAPYRPRFTRLEALWRRIAAGPPPAATLGGCLLRHEGERSLMVCREPAAMAPPVPTAAEALAAGIVWDGRWRVRLVGGGPAAATAREGGENGECGAHGAHGGFLVGALGAAGLRHLAAAARARRWTAPARWRAAPRVVRAATPALWRLPQEGGPPTLVAAPLAAYAEEAPDAGAIMIEVENLAPGPLPFTMVPD